jgi:hypothetical protein
MVGPLQSERWPELFMEESVGRRVLIPFPGLGTLALDEDVYRRALEEGSKFNAPPQSPDPNERLLDSQQLADVLQIPVTWIEQQASEGNIPSLPYLIEHDRG